MLIKRKLVIIIVLLFILNGFYFGIKKWKLNLNNQSNFKIENVKKSFLERESILFASTSKLNSIVFDFWSISGKEPNNALMVFLPKKACWSCFESKLNKLGDIKKKYSIELVYIASKLHMRSLKILLPKKVFSKDVMSFSSFKPEDIMALPLNDIAFVVYDNSNQICIPYIENKIIDPIRFIEMNYYSEYDINREV